MDEKPPFRQAIISALTSFLILSPLWIWLAYRSSTWIHGWRTVLIFLSLVFVGGIIAEAVATILLDVKLFSNEPGFASLKSLNLFMTNFAVAMPWCALSLYAHSQPQMDFVAHELSKVGLHEGMATWFSCIYIVSIGGMAVRILAIRRQK